MFSFWGLHAQDAATVLAKTIATYNASGAVAIDYQLRMPDGTSQKGTVSMKGRKYRIIADGLKCWYDGKTLWTYSTISGEVNVSEPADDELQMCNPYLALTQMRNRCHVYRAFTQVAGYYTLKLVPKRKMEQVKQLLIYVKNGSDSISKIVFDTVNSERYVTTVLNYKRISVSDNTFTFDKTQVPAGTEIIDLR